MPVDPTKFAEATARIKREWKQDLWRKGNDYPDLLRVPTGSYELDWATYGGFPVGRWTRLWGSESTAKSLVTWNVIRNAQNIHIISQDRFARLIEEATARRDKDLLKRKLDDIMSRFPDGMKCCYYDVEGTYHPEWVASMGVDIKELEIMEGRIIEQIGDALESTMSSCHLHAIDSTTSAISLRSLEGDVTQEPRGVDAARWQEMFKRAEARFDTRENMVIYISQARVVQQGPRAGSEQPPGGRKMGHSSSLTLHMKPSSWLYRSGKGILVDKDQSSETISGLKEPDGVEVTARVAKNKTAPPFRTARMRLDFANGRYDLGYELAEAGRFFGFIQDSGSWRHLADPATGERLGGRENQFQGEAPLRERLRADVGLRERIRDAMLESRDSRAGDVGPDDDPEE